MTGDQARPLGPDEMPLPMGVQAESGQLLPGLRPEDVRWIDPDPDFVQARASAVGADFMAVSGVDPNRLEEAGWGIVFPRDIDPGVRKKLQPLIDHRRAQVPDPLFKVFEGPTGYQPGDSVEAWLGRFNVGLAQVDPLLGVPLYLTIVGSPDEVPFQFQYLLDTYWAVGRLSFETAAEYEAYARHVVAYETAAAAPRARRVAVFSVRHPGDRPTALLMDQLAAPLVHGTSTAKPLGERQGFQRQPFLGEKATKGHLLQLLHGPAPGGPPALLFTGSHGARFSPSDPDQRAKQGAILCQEWPGGPSRPEHCVAASDLPADANLRGLIHFSFACYSGGCPKFDTYERLPDGSPKQIAAGPMVARLPQRMLASGALAVVGHIDRAWTHSFRVARGVPQIQEFTEVMSRAMDGERIGQCTDRFNLRWTVLTAALEVQRRLGIESQMVIANRWVARDDARNYVILGDPAVRLRVESLVP